MARTESRVPTAPAVQYQRGTGGSPVILFHPRPSSKPFPRNSRFPARIELAIHYPIHQRMYEAIGSSEIFIADLRGLRPNVTIELGYALNHMHKGRLDWHDLPLKPRSSVPPLQAVGCRVRISEFFRLELFARRRWDSECAVGCRHCGESDFPVSTVIVGKSLAGVQPWALLVGGHFPARIRMSEACSRAAEARAARRRHHGLPRDAAARRSTILYLVTGARRFGRR